MPDDNVRLSAGEITRWLILAALLAGCIGLYFVYSPSVPPAIGRRPGVEAP